MSVLLFRRKNDSVRSTNEAIKELKKRSRSSSTTVNQPQCRTVKCYFDTSANGNLNVAVIKKCQLYITDKMFVEDTKWFLLDSDDKYELWLLLIKKKKKTKNNRENNNENDNENNNNNNNNVESNNENISNNRKKRKIKHNDNNNNNNNIDTNSNIESIKENISSKNIPNNANSPDRQREVNYQDNNAPPVPDEMDEEEMNLINGLLRKNNYKETHTVTDTNIMTEMLSHCIIPALIRNRIDKIK
jgi:hypothetical protein